MSLLKILKSNWIKDQIEADDTELYENNFNNSKRTRELLELWINHKLEEIDRETSLSKLKEKTDRAELVLILIARRDMLLELKKLISINED